MVIMVKTDIKLFTYIVLCHQHLYIKCHLPKKASLRGGRSSCHSDFTLKFYFIEEYFQRVPLLLTKHSLMKHL
jgi:hypothetical protein